MRPGEDEADGRDEQEGLREADDLVQEGGVDRVGHRPQQPFAEADDGVDDEQGAPAEEELPFEVEVMRGTESVRLSSRDLPPWLRDQLSAMVRDGNLESAAVQLSSHSELSVPEAYELLRRMRERRGEG